MITRIVPALVAATLMGGTGSAGAVTLMFGVNSESDNSPFPSSDPLNSIPFGDIQGEADPDFRMITWGTVSGGEQQIAAGVTWTFDDVTGELISVSGTDVTPGAAAYATYAGVASAAPDGDTGLFRNFFALGELRGFLAPTVGSAAAAAYGAASIDFSGGGDDFTIYFPVIESQWAETLDTLGLHSGGITFDCTGKQSGNLFCRAEEQLHPMDESVGFAGYYFQWELEGTIAPSEVPLPAAFWLFGSGLAGLAILRRRVRMAE